jgi:hypothetical protein
MVFTEEMFEADVCSKQNRTIPHKKFWIRHVLLKRVAKAEKLY